MNSLILLLLVLAVIFVPSILLPHFLERYSRIIALRKCASLWENIDKAALPKNHEGDERTLQDFRELYALARHHSITASDFGAQNFEIIAYDAYLAFCKATTGNAVMKIEAEKFCHEYVNNKNLFAKDVIHRSVMQA